MSQFIWNIQFTSIAQILIFVALAFYLVLHRKNPRLVVSRPSFVYLAILLLVFLYFVWSWSSVVLPSLRTINLLGMLGINVIMLSQLISTWLEQPYRRALDEFGQNPEDEPLLEDVWSTGKRFYYFAYVGFSLVSGIAPWQFLRENALERIRTDIQGAMGDHGKRPKIISFRGMVAFLWDRLGKDEFLPEEFKEHMIACLGRFAQHSWAEERVNEYLTLILERPEELLRPELFRALKGEEEEPSA